MNFRIRRREDDVEINFVPLIDVLVVLLIFLMVTTTFGRLGAMGIELPSARASAAPDDEVITLAIDARGEWRVDDKPVSGHGREALEEALRRASVGQESPRVVLSADRRTAHERVILAMEAARAAGLLQLSFAVAAPNE